MGSARRPHPARLANKLKEVRLKLDITQQEMVSRLSKAKVSLKPGHISEYELGKREPPLPVLLQYSRIAGIPMELLVDDDLDLPKHLPSTPNQEWIMRPVRPGQRRN